MNCPALKLSPLLIQVLPCAPTGIESTTSGVPPTLIVPPGAHHTTHLHPLALWRWPIHDILGTLALWRRPIHGIRVTTRRRLPRLHLPHNLWLLAPWALIFAFASTGIEPTTSATLSCPGVGESTSSREPTYRRRSQPHPLINNYPPVTSASHPFYSSYE